MIVQIGDVDAAAPEILARPKVKEALAATKARIVAAMKDSRKPLRFDALLRPDELVVGVVAKLHSSDDKKGACLDGAEAVLLTVRDAHTGDAIKVKLGRAAQTFQIGDHVIAWRCAADKKPTVMLVERTAASQPPVRFAEVAPRAVEADDLRAAASASAEALIRAGELGLRGGSARFYDGEAGLSARWSPGQHAYFLIERFEVLNGARCRPDALSAEAKVAVGFYVTDSGPRRGKLYLFASMLAALAVVGPRANDLIEVQRLADEPAAGVPKAQAFRDDDAQHDSVRARYAARVVRRLELELAAEEAAA